MRISVLAIFLLAGVAVEQLPAHAQGFIKKESDLPKVNWYMARQQITITDDAPIINDQRTGPGAAASGGMQGGRLPLPKAGWQPYSSSIPSVRSGLPQVNNGVPPRMPDPPPVPAGLRGRAGNLKAKPAAAARPSTVQNYKAYKGYGVGATPSSTGYGNSNARTSTSVRGVLHWARPKSSN